MSPEDFCRCYKTHCGNTIRKLGTGEAYGSHSRVCKGAHALPGSLVGCACLVCYTGGHNNHNTSAFLVPGKEQSPTQKDTARANNNLLKIRANNNLLKIQRIAIITVLSLATGAFVWSHVVYYLAASTFSAGEAPWAWGTYPRIRRLAHGIRRLAQTAPPPPSRRTCRSFTCVFTPASRPTQTTNYAFAT